MRFVLLPWKPELIFTGTSVMGINPETGKFCSHAVGFSSPVKSKYRRDLMTDPLTASVSLIRYIYIYTLLQDYWDSIEKNDYFSLEGLWDVMKQVHPSP